MSVYLKSLFYLVIFSILHFGYDLTHWAFLVPFCGINESVFQRLKMAFWAYLLTSLLEYFGTREKISEVSLFWYSRVLSAVILPWFTVLIWYLVPAIFGRIKFLSLEVVWATLSTYFSAVVAGTMEKNVEKSRMDSIFRIIILVLFIISVFLYVRFTYKLPWIDLFVNPEVLRA